MRTTSSHPSADMVAKLRLPPPMLVPALVTRMSMRPWRFSMSAAARATASRSPTSSSVASALPIFFSSVSALSLVRAVRPEMITCAPALASSLAPARPMPEPPPVIQATFPFSSVPGILLGSEEVLLLLRRHRRPAPVGEHLHRALHRGPRGDAVAPALHVRILLDVHALALREPQPRHDRHVGDGVLAAGDELRLAEAPLEHAVQPVGLVAIAVHRVLELLRRVLQEVVRLAEHRADVPHLEHDPLHHLPALADVLG